MCPWGNISGEKEKQMFQKNCKTACIYEATCIISKILNEMHWVNKPSLKYTIIYLHRYYMKYTLFRERLSVDYSVWNNQCIWEPKLSMCKTV